MFWFVSFPLAKYVEDVVAIAALHKLEIIDQKFKDSIDPSFYAKEVPELTLKSSVIVLEKEVGKNDETKAKTKTKAKTLLKDSEKESDQ